MSLLDLFKTKRNPVQEHSVLIFKLAAEAGDAFRAHLKENGEELSKTAWFGVLMEYQNFYMQLTDRAIFGNIDETKRKVLMNGFAILCIDSAVNTICQGWDAERIGKIQKECMDNYRKSFQDYGGCKKLFPDKGEGTGGTMAWEFTKTIAGIVGHEMDVTYIMFAMQIIDFKRLGLKEFVAGVKTLV